MQIMAILCDCLITSGAREVIGLLLLYIRVRYLTILSRTPCLPPLSYKLQGRLESGSLWVQPFFFLSALHCIVIDWLTD